MLGQMFGNDGTCFIQISGSLEEAWQCGLQHHDKVFQLFCDSHQHVLIHQVVLGLIQSPLAAHVPAQTPEGVPVTVLLLYREEGHRRLRAGGAEQREADVNTEETKKTTTVTNTEAGRLMRWDGDQAVVRMRH